MTTRFVATKRITPRTKVGWNYSCYTRNTQPEDGIENPTKPLYTGTMRQVCVMKEADRRYKMMRFMSLGHSVICIVSWFVRHNNEWWRVVDSTTMELMSLMEASGYIDTVEIEKVIELKEI